MYWWIGLHVHNILHNGLFIEGYMKSLITVDQPQAVDDLESILFRSVAVIRIHVLRNVSFVQYLSYKHFWKTRCLVDENWTFQFGLPRNQPWCPYLSNSFSISLQPYFHGCWRICICVSFHSCISTYKHAF